MRILDEYLQSVIFLYPSAESALAGSGSGATGFLVRYRHPDGVEVDYVLTNSHVVLQGATYMRYNTTTGQVGVSEVPIAKWEHGAGYDDVSAAVMPTLKESVHKPLEWHEYALKEADVEDLYIGPGDDVVMVGRLSGYDGLMQLEPVARFGNIARMPREPVRDAHGHFVSVFLVEMRSQSGFSGSPVYGVIPPGSFRRPGEAIRVGELNTFLLGLDCGHIAYRRGIADAAGDEASGWAIKENSGISLVLPAWTVERLLEALRPLS